MCKGISLECIAITRQSNSMANAVCLTVAVYVYDIVCSATILTSSSSCKQGLRTRISLSVLTTRWQTRNALQKRGYTCG